MRLIRIALAVFFTSLVLHAHGGGLDSYGGHNDRKAGTYHFHRGPLAGQSFASKADGIAALQGYQSKAAKPQAKNETRASENKDPETRTVYITRTGKKYHGPSCQ